MKNKILVFLRTCSYYLFAFAAGVVAQEELLHLKGDYLFFIAFVSMIFVAVFSSSDLFKKYKK